MELLDSPAADTIDETITAKPASAKRVLAIVHIIHRADNMRYSDEALSSWRGSGRSGV